MMLSLIGVFNRYFLILVDVVLQLPCVVRSFFLALAHALLNDATFEVAKELVPL